MAVDGMSLGNARISVCTAMDKLEFHVSRGLAFEGLLPCIMLFGHIS